MDEPIEKSKVFNSKSQDSTSQVNDSFMQTNKDLIKKKCIMNTVSNYSDEFYQTFKCAECEVEGICEECMKDCHSHGKTIESVEQFKQGEVRIVDQGCSCANESHSFGRATTTKIDPDNYQKKGCQLSSKDYGVNSSTLFFMCTDNVTKQNIIVCIYCKSYCFKEKNVSFGQVINDPAMTFKCTCEQDHKNSKLKPEDQQEIKESFSKHENPILLAQQLWDSTVLRGIVFHKMEGVLEEVKTYCSGDMSRRSGGFNRKSSKKNINKQRDNMLFTELNLFSLWLETLKKMKVNLLALNWANYFDFDSIIHFASSYADNTDFNHADCLVYYIRWFKIIYCEKESNVNLLGKSVSSLHRIFLMKRSIKKVQATKIDDNGNAIKYDKTIEEALEDFLTQIQISMKKSQCSLELIREYFQILEYIIDSSHNNFPKIKEYMMKYTDQETIKVMTKMLGARIIDSIYEKIKCLVEKVSIYQNDYIFYLKLFKNFNSNRKEEEKEANFFFEQTDFNKHLLMLLFDYFTEPNQYFDKDYKRLLDDMFNHEDYFIETLEQFSKTRIDLTANIKRILDGNDKEYIDSMNLQSEFESLKMLIEGIIKEVNKPSQIDHELVIEKIIELKTSIHKIIFSKTYNQKEVDKFKLVFVTSGQLFEILDVSNDVCDFINNTKINESNRQKFQKFVETYRVYFFDIINYICSDNPFVTAIFFDQNQLFNKRYRYVQLKNYSSLKLYLELLKVFRNTDTKINTEFFREEFGKYIESIIPQKDKEDGKEKDETSQMKILITVFEVARLTLAVSSEKSFVSTCQYLSVQIFNIWTKFELEKKLKYEGLKPIELNVFLAYFSFVNKLNNDSFDLFKYTIDSNNIDAMINGKSTTDMLTPELSMLKAELILFYTKYHFSSVYTKEATSLLAYTDLQMSVNLIEPIYAYFKDFTTLMHQDLTPRQFISHFIKGICIPSMLIIWKIATFATLDGIARFGIYNLACWQLIHLKFVLDHFTYLKESKKITEEEELSLFKSYFVNPVNLVRLREAVTMNYEKITDKDFKCLDAKECLSLFFDTMGHFKFYNNSKQYMEEVEKEDSADDVEEDDEEGKEENEVNEQGLSMSALLENMIVNYKAKKKSLKNNILMELFSENETINSQAITIGNNLIESLAKNIKQDNPKAKTENPLYIIDAFDMSKVPFLTIMNKLFKKNPKEWQEIILNNTNSPRLIHQFMTEVIKIFAQFTFADYCRILVDKSQYYFLLMECIEFLRLLCEDHNPYFQTILIQSNSFFINDYPFIDLIFDMSVKITKDLSFFTKNKETLGRYFKKNMYWKNLADKLCDFQVEIIQGTKLENLKYLTKNNKFDKFIDESYNFLDHCVEGNESAHLCAKFLGFINCFFEEFLVYKHENIKEDINGILSKLNPKNLVVLGEKSFEKIFINSNEKQVSSNQKNVDHTNLLKEQSEEVLERLYQEYPVVTSNPFFKNAFSIFLHLVQMKDYKNEKFCQYDQIMTLISTPSNIKSYAYYNFCFKLLNTNEVMYTLTCSQNTKEGERYCNAFHLVIQDSTKKEEFDNCIRIVSNGTPKQINRLKIYYLAERDSTLLQDTDYDSFQKVAKHDDYYSKLSGILQYYDEYSKMIDMRKKFINQKQYYLITFNEFNYDLLETVNCYLCFIPNILLIFKRDTFDIYSQIILYWEFIHLIFLGLIISNYIIFNLLKSKLPCNDKAKSNEEEEQPSTCELFLKSFLDKRILLFEWIFLWGLLGVRYDFLLSLQLFAIFTIYPTMRNVLYAIQTRYEQFLSTGFLLIILILFYSAISLYFFQTPDTEGITCGSYWECFLYLMNNGIRAGGVEFQPKIIEQPGYWAEFVYSWIFYFLIILIILNIINGIIVDTFQSLREENNTILESTNNICFICQLARNSFENKGLNYENHLEKEHNVMGYFKYLFLLQRTDQHDLNSVNFQVYNAIKAGKVEFFPIEKANGFEENDDKKDDDNDKDKGKEKDKENAFIDKTVTEDNN